MSGKVTTWRFYEGDNYSEASMQSLNHNYGMNEDKIREFVAKEDLQPFVDDIKKYCCGQDKCQKRGTLCGSLTRFLKAWEGE